MNEMVRAGFLRRLAAFVIDALTVFTLSSLLFGAWGIRLLGGMPETGEQFGVLVEAGANVIDLLMTGVWMVYLLLSWTPVLGRRSVGMRQMGIQIVRDPR